ncbi:PhzF family phenazine biosynthesis protein [uncultured Roseovarius sp.]|uniref:PhzF family phenazine biosynthesis protein n=1 Tax=uncultured Roseovarius sp. TaxID=293344 RepID=UPI00263512E8|nr:PhzF family phenazine biosynthesis protein [uncultured Roseovarius sp.]
MTTRRFVQCDVFSSVPIKGNGLAVVVDGDGLSDRQMQEFAAWTNLAETTFLQAPTDPQADYKLRIFSPAREMLFAGHPTLGSCAAWLHAGGVPKDAGIIQQECAIGLVPIDMRGPVPAFVAPPTPIAPLPDANRARLIAALGLDDSDVIRSAHLTNGPEWQVLELKNAQAVLDVDASNVRWPEYQGVSLIGAHASGSDCDYEVRNVSPSSGMNEDPITGSLNSALAMWMHHEGRLTRDIVVAQGTCLGRLGRVYISVDAQHPGRVLIGGETRIVIEGTVQL